MGQLFAPCQPLLLHVNFHSQQQCKSSCIHNPPTELKDRCVLVCDAKLNFDDNADFQQNAIQEDSWRRVQKKVSSSCRAVVMK
eukprot:1713282-Amphidinium_carterae.1